MNRHSDTHGSPWKRSSQARSPADRGVEFERYDGVEQDEVGVWQAPVGGRVARFKDPDGNTLSLAEFTT